MTYPYPELVSQLQFLCSPQEYQNRIKRFYDPSMGVIMIPYHIPAYWEIMPHYTYARCPLCGLAYREPADTYTFGSWGGAYILRDALQMVAEHYRYELPRCPHFVGVTPFFNLHDQTLPKDREWHNRTGEVPFLTDSLLPDDLKAQAVLHALPICSIVDNRFVPTYTVFVVTYFCEDPKSLIARCYRAEWERGKNDPEFFPAILDYVGRLPNLISSAKKGKLGWLDFDSPDLPLRMGPNDYLPDIYRVIRGKPHEYMVNQRDYRLNPVPRNKSDANQNPNLKNAEPRSRFMNWLDNLTSWRKH